MGFGISMMMSQMVAYENTNGSSLSVSLSLSNLQFGSRHQLKASAALLVQPDPYTMLKSNRASSLSQQTCDAPNLLFCTYARGLLSV